MSSNNRFLLKTSVTKFKRERERERERTEKTNQKSFKRTKIVNTFIREHIRTI